MVNVSPTPMASIKGTTAALLPAPNMYCMMYFPVMTSDFFRGETSTGNVYEHALFQKGKEKETVAAYQLYKY